MIKSIVILWLVVAIVLWVWHKARLGNTNNGTPQSTLAGALMWPIYVGEYLYDKFKERNKR